MLLALRFWWCTWAARGYIPLFGLLLISFWVRLLDAVNRRLDEWVQVDAMDLNTVETENDDNKDDKVETLFPDRITF